MTTTPTFKETLAKLRPVDLDEFETSITADMVKELQDGNTAIDSLPVEISAGVRQDLIRLLAWAQIPNRLMLITAVQGDDLTVMNQMREYCRTYSEFANVHWLSIESPDFQNEFMRLMESRQKDLRIIVAVPFNKFCQITVKNEMAMQAQGETWQNYVFMTEMLPPQMKWQVILHNTTDGRSTFVYIPLITLTMALLQDRAKADKK